MELTDKRRNILGILARSKVGGMTPTEIGKGSGERLDDPANWACAGLRALVENKFVSRKEVKVVGKKRKKIEYSLMAKGRKAA